MADNNTNTNTEPNNNGGATAGTPTTGTPAGATPTNNEAMIPKHRFDEVYGQMKTLQEQLKAIEEAKALDATKKLEETSQFKTLYEQQKAEFEAIKTQAEAFKTSATQYETVINSMVESKLASVPQELHELIPANLTASEKLDWINKAEQKGLFGVKQNNNVPIGQPMNVPHATPDISKMSAMEKLKMAYSTK